MNQNSTFLINPDGWFHICNVGSFLHSKGLQVINREDLASMVAKFKPTLLIDYDHLSHDPSQKTEAAGWVDQLEIRNGDQLWARARWSSEGIQKLEGGVYRFQSPVFNVEKKKDGLHPIELLRIALTNDPNLKGLTPLSNRREDKEVPTPIKNKGEVMNKDMILQLTGLPETATDEEINSSLSGLQGRLSGIEAIETRNRELETEVKTLRENQIEDDLKALSDEEKAVWRPVLTMNRENGLKALAMSRRPAPVAKAPLANRHPAQTPAMNESPKKSLLVRQQEAIAMESVANRGASHEEAYQLAKQKNPELFQASEDKE